MFSANGSQVSSAATYIEDVFSTYLYTGTSGAQSINNGIDLTGKGGMVWLKSRTAVQSHGIFDTARGADNYLCSDSTASQFNYPNNGISFTSTGFATDAASYFGGTGAGSTDNYVSWTFRKQPKFFDCGTFSGTGSVRTIAHSLGSVPGCIIVKKIDASDRDWIVYHRSLGATKYMALNQTYAQDTWSVVWNNTEPTSTEFTVGTFNGVNGSGFTYVWYAFAHDAGGFGLTGTDNVISCGSYTGTGTAGLAVSLGYEPQWVIIKKTSGADYWYISDNMRNMNNDGTTTGAALLANDPMAEYTSNDKVSASATGFIVNNTNGGLNASGGTYVYIAIRRGPMKVPTDATKVFSPNAYTEILTNPTVLSAGFPPDMYMTSTRNPAYGFYVMDKLRGSDQTNNNYLVTPSTAGEGTTGASPARFDLSNDGIAITYLSNNTAGRTDIVYQFKRAPSFFDEVCYTGTGANRTVTHNLGVTPELIIVKRRDDGVYAGRVYHKDLGSNYWLYLFYSGSDAAVQGPNSGVWNGAPTSTIFNTGNDNGVNASGSAIVAWLFATCPGVSKVGSYTGNGSSQTIACGFAAGARFVMIKRTDSTGDWYVWDTARGIVSGNDPHLSLNTTAAEVTTDDTIDPDSSGFIVNQLSATNVNVNAATYIFLAIA